MKGKQKFTQKGNSGKEQFKQVKSKLAVTTKQKCEKCNGPPHGRMRCPARDSLCNNCGQKGHCKTVSQVTADLEDTTQQFDDSFFLGEIIEAKNSVEIYSQHWKAEVLLNNSKVSFKLASSVDVTIILLDQFDLYEKLYNQADELQPTNKVLMEPWGQTY